MKKAGLIWLGILLLAPGLAWSAMCEKGRVYLELAQDQPEPRGQILLLTRSLSECLSVEAYLALAKAQTADGRHVEAERSCQEAKVLAERDNDHRGLALAAAGMGRFHLAAGRPALAAALLRRSLDMYPRPELRVELKALEIALSQRIAPADDLTAILALKDFGGRYSLTFFGFFDSGSAMLTPRGRDQADQLALTLTRGDLTRRFILIVGHADGQGPEEPNLRLSESRALAVRNYLMEKHRVNSVYCRVTGRGLAEPLYPGTTDEDNFLNRRVEVRLSD